MTLTSAIKAAKKQGFDIELDNTEIIVYLPGAMSGKRFKRSTEEKQATAFIEEHLDEDDTVTGGPTGDISDYDY